MPITLSRRHTPGRWCSCLALLAVAASLVSACTTSRSGAPPATTLPEPAATAQWRLDWANGSAFYEIFVRSFADSDGDGVGDLRGLTSRLDYLNDGDPSTTADLGIEGIWLMPVFASPSYHGYDTTDYETINPAYGTNEDFARFLAEAHRRGIKVVLDLVINHTGRDHPWFVESASSPSSPKRDWYVWRATDPGWKQPWGDQRWPSWHELNGAYFYGIFWEGMPDLNLESPAARAEVERIAKLWLDRGVDGFRLDAARHIIATGPGQEQNDTPQTHAFWREFSASTRDARPDALLVGENWTSTDIIATYYGNTATVTGGDELPMSFDFPLAGAIVSAVDGGDASPVRDALAAIQAAYPPGVLDGTFLTNHDMVRVATQLGSDRGKLGAAAALLLTLPGTPFLYYGEEVGLINGGPGGDDRLKRTPMPWDSSAGGGFTTGAPWFAFAPGRDSVNVEVQTGDPHSLLSRYRELIRLRAASPALRRGSLELLVPATAGAGVLAFVRSTATEQVLVVHNLGGSPATAGPLAIGAGLDPLLVDSGVEAPAGGPGAWRLTLPARSVGIWRLRQRQ